MRPSWRPWFVLILATAPSSLALRKQDHASYDYYAVEVDPLYNVSEVAARLGLQVHSPLGELKDHWLLEGAKRPHNVVHEAIQHHNRHWRRTLDSDVLDGVLLSQKQVLRKKLFKRVPPPLDPPMHAESKLAARANNDNEDSEDDEADDAYRQKGDEIAKTLGIHDPIFNEQWHLFNREQRGHDINVTGVWMQGITGKNSTTCIVDDGLDMDSDDLKDNYFAAGSYDFNDKVDDPKPRLSDDRHGTRCAGEIAAVRNDVCGVGVAYDSRISGLRILSAIISDADEAVAMNYAFHENQIYSCSWGPPDDGKSMEAPGILIKRAMVNGIQNGRHGHGSIFVFAIGNGAAADDNCNFDGYTNSIYSVSVGGIDRKGLHPYYSEKCSAQLVVTYSSGSGDGIHTTDVGKAECWNTHGGTSAAGPLVAGVYALCLEVRPDLSWRDIQWLSIMTAVPINEDDGEWQETPIGLRFSHQYGYGKIDAYATVEMAKTWKNVKPQAWYFSPWLHVKHDIPQGSTGLQSEFVITKEQLKEANLERVEHVTITMNVQHTRRGDLSAELKSPGGVVSYIATARRNDDAASGYVDWTFMSVAHFGESGVGKWTVIVKDTNVNEHTGHFQDWRIKLFGESIDASSQELLPMPTEHDDDDHNVEQAPVATTSHGDPTQTGTPPGNPTDHIDRPGINKPDQDTTTSQSSSTSTSTPSPTASNPTGDTEDELPAEPSETPDSNFLPHYFPTFGASKRTQVWIYGALALIVAFCVSLGAWYTVTRRRRRRNARDEYEFEMLDEEDDGDDTARTGLNGANGFGNGHAGGKKGKRRAGELYDAFAEGSDEEGEEDVFSVGDEEDEGEEHHDARDGRYRDEDERERRR